MSDCSKKIDAILDKYLTYGWSKLVDLFHKEKYAKEKRLKKKSNNQYILLLLGCLRAYIVENAFQCLNRDPNTFYVAYGSTNITSDYDVILVGHNAPELMNKMFLAFLDDYGDTLSHSLDTNLYCSFYLSPLKIHNIPGIYNPKGKEWALFIPKTQCQKEVTLNYAILKLLQSGVKGGFPEYISEKVPEALFLGKKFHKMFQEQYKKIKKKKQNKKDTLQLITRYHLYYKLSKKLYCILYKHQPCDSRQLAEAMCSSAYFAIEGYYTPGAFNTVVMELQAGEKLPLSQMDYLCSVLENLGDLRIHLSGELKRGRRSKKELLLKYSKYVYRIYYSLNKLLPKKYSRKKLRELKEKVINFRKTNSIKEARFSLIHYHNQSVHSYLQSFTKEIIKTLHLLTLKRLLKN